MCKITKIFYENISFVSGYKLKLKERKNQSLNFDLPYL